MDHIDNALLRVGKSMEHAAGLRPFCPERIGRRPRAGFSAIIGSCLMTLAFSVGAQSVPPASQAVPSNALSYVRTTAFTYNASGLLETERIEPDIPEQCVVTTYTYDSGNKTESTTSSCVGVPTNADFAQRESRSTFGARQAGSGSHFPGGTFATGSEVFFTTVAGNPDSHTETRDYDPRFGTLVKLVGPNQIETRWQYDDFGRKTAELKADGTKNIFAYCLLLPGYTSSNSPACHNGSAPSLPAPISNEIPIGAVRYEHSEQQLQSNNTKIGAFTRVYYDAAGRRLRTVTQGFQGTLQLPRLVFQNTEYNVQGMVVVTTQPYFANTNGSTVNSGIASMFRPYGLQRTSYDALGRPTQVLVADDLGSQEPQNLGNGYSLRSAKTSFTYDGLITTITDDKGNTRSEEKNPEGQIVRTTDALLAQVLHQHDAFGNLIETRDPHDNKIIVRYDTRGRKISINDPDAGVTQSCYDALGQLKSQQSSKERGHHGLSSCPATGSIGVVAEVAAGWTTFAYDRLGRMSERRDPNYTTNWYHDKYFGNLDCFKGKGKLCEVRTTSGLQRRYVYDDKGRPLSTRVDQPGAPAMATAVSYHAFTGRLATQTYPTGVRLKYFYTASTGFLASVGLDSAVSNLAGAVVNRTLWQALTVNAWGKVEHQSYSVLNTIYDENYNINGYSGYMSEAVYDGVTGRLTQVGAGTSGHLLPSTVNPIALGEGNASLFHHRYEWNSLNLLTSRIESKTLQGQPNIRDTFKYDALGRLNHYAVSNTGGTTPGEAPFPAREVALRYNALGMLLYKSDVGVYSYGGKGVANGKPHAVLSIGGQLNASFSAYDMNGNLTSASGRPYANIGYTSFNLPDSQTGVQGPGSTAMPRYTWVYGEDRQRIKEVRVNAAGTRTTYFMHPDNQGGLGFEHEIAPNGTVTSRHYLPIGGGAMLVTVGALPTLGATQLAPPNADGAQVATLVASQTGARLDFWHRDHLGSVIAVSDGMYTVHQRFSYDPFGLRRQLTGSYDPMGTLVFDWEFGTPKTDRGFTGHEHLDDVGLIQMNGRVFDPRIGRFLQADPFVQDPLNLQNFDRYAYCYNSPLVCTDPSGQIFKWLSRKWRDEVWRSPIGRAVVTIAVAYFAPYALEFYGSFAAGTFATTSGLTLTGAATGGFLGGAVSTGNLKGALQGAFSAAMFFGAGDLIHADGMFAGTGGIESGFGQAVVHGVTGCITSVAGGGKCGPGALSAAFSKAAVPLTKGLGGFEATLVHSIIGGTAAELGGGKFANGAMTGAFSYLFNHLGKHGVGQGPKQPGWGYEYSDVDHPFAPTDEFKTRFFGSEEERRVWFRTLDIAAGNAQQREWLRFDDPKVQLPRSGGPLYQIFDLGLAEAGPVRIAYSPKFPNVFYVSLDHYQPTPAQPLRWTRFEAAPPKN